MSTSYKNFVNRYRNDIIYPNIKSFMEENEFSYSDIAFLLHYSPTHIRTTLVGKVRHPSVPLIDAMSKLMKQPKEIVWKMS